MTTLTGPGVDCRRGQTIPAAATSPVPHPGGVAWLPTTEGRALPKAEVLALHAAGELPAPEDQLVARLTPATSGWALDLTVRFASRPPATRRFDFAADPGALDEEGRAAAAFVFVQGPEALPDGFSFPLIHVVDVTEPGAPGHAPAVDLAAGGAATTITLGGAAPPPQELFECVCLPGVTFEFDRSFIRPSVVEHLKRVDEVLAAHPQAKLFITGHTDRVAPEAYNKRLSDRRAYSTYAFITDDAHAWELLYNEEQWGLRTVQVILADLGHDPGPIDGLMGPRTQAAMAAFLGLPAGTPVANDAPFRAKLFLAYMTGKHDVRAVDAQFLPPRFTGCGEFNPLVPPNAAELANAAPGNEPNRRVVIYMLGRAPGPIPCALDDMGPCKAEIGKPGARARFACAFYDGLAARCGCEGGKKEVPPPPPPAGDVATLTVKVVKGTTPPEPFVGAQVALLRLPEKVPAGAFNAGPGGVVSGLKLAPGEYSVQVSSPDPVWGKASERVVLAAGEARTVVVTLHRQGQTVPVGYVKATVTRNGQPVEGKKVFVHSDDGKGHQAVQYTGADGHAHFVLEAGEYVVNASIAPFAFGVALPAGGQRSVVFDGKMPKVITVDPVSWDTYFNQQFPLCLNEYMFLKAGGALLPWFAELPMRKGRDYVLECMASHVQARVAAEDKASGRPPQSSRTRDELRRWYQSNKDKFDGLD